MASSRPEPGRSIGELRPDLTAEWHPSSNQDLTPFDVALASHKRVWWICAHGHEWDAPVYSRAAGNRCPYCSNQRVLAGYNDLATTNPTLAAEAFGWDPTTLTAISGKKRQWRCEQGHVWTDSVAHRSYDRGCPYCSNKRVLPGYNDLASQHPDIALEWHPTRNAPLIPSQVAPRSAKKAWWLCQSGHEWRASINNRTSPQLNARCPYCSNQRVLVGYNDLATTNPNLAAEAFDWDPTTLTAGANQKRAWVCSKGHTWVALVSSRNQGNGCPYCANQLVLAGFNDLATVNPALAAEWHPTKNKIQPDSITSFTRKKVWWLCDHGHSWAAQVASRSIGTGCPVCASHGFNPGLDGWLYFLIHPDWKMQQIGITNRPKRRLKDHRNRGWEVLEIRGPMPGDLTRSLELGALAALRRRGAELGTKKSLTKFDGHTESWTIDSLHVSGIGELLGWVYEDES